MFPQYDLFLGQWSQEEMYKYPFTRNCDGEQLMSETKNKMCHMSILRATNGVFCKHLWTMSDNNQEYEY